MRCILTLASTRHFAINGTTGGGGGRHPLCFSKLRVVALSGKDHRIYLDEYSRLVVRFLTPVMRGQRSNFLETGNFSTLNVHILKAISRIETKPSPSCSPFNSEKNDVLFWYLGRMLGMYSIPDGNTVTLTGKIARGQNG